MTLPEAAQAYTVFPEVDVAPTTEASRSIKTTLAAFRLRHPSGNDHRLNENGRLRVAAL
jgi:hypothetical protein